MGKCTGIMREEITVRQKKTKNWDGNEKANKSKLSNFLWITKAKVTTSYNGIWKRHQQQIGTQSTNWTLKNQTLFTLWFLLIPIPPALGSQISTTQQAHKFKSQWDFHNTHHWLIVLISCLLSNYCQFVPLLSNYLCCTSSLWQLCICIGSRILTHSLQSCIFMM